MRKIRLKKTIIIVSLMLSLIILELIGILPYVTSRISSSIYVSINYPNNNFEFSSSEYAYGFGDYFVRYESNDENSQDLGLMIYPKEFPIFIRYDSIKKTNSN